jgi:two-component sensor histidine kinase
MTLENEATIIARLETDNRRLRGLLEAKDAPGELRHRLRNTMSLMRTIVRKSAETKRDLEAYVGHLEDRMDALARAQAAADARGEIDFHNIVADELLRYDVKEGERLHLSGPTIHFQPRAGQLMALAIHELAVNAIEHGPLVSPRGQIKVEWRRDPDEIGRPLTFVWKESGHAASFQPSRTGFGTEMLTRALAYELSAESRLEFEADGLRYTLRFLLSERIGRMEESKQ